MKIDLLKYMSDRFNQESKLKKDPGPVITISREYGCPARKVANKLIKALHDKSIVKGKEKEWRFVSKEILNESAKELKMNPDNIKYVFDYEQKSIIDDILSAHMSKYYKSDRKIRNTVAKVIRSVATEGNAVIVGRGGVAICRDIPKSLHIHLEAPIEWRILRASEKNNIPMEEAKEVVEDIDQKRRQFREYFEGKNTDYTRFDLSLNCMTLSVNEIAQTILKLAELRYLV